jgi:DNA-binding NtrC family response regulator
MPVPAASPPCVLVVDDERGVRESLHFLLEPHFTVEIASSGEAALALLAERTFDVVVLDLAMPDLNGVETLERIRAIDPRVEVVISTGYGSKTATADVARLGAYRLVQKPFNSAEIVSIVRGAARARRES